MPMDGMRQPNSGAFSDPAQVASGDDTQEEQGVFDVAKEKLMELLVFDTIDERPAKEATEYDAVSRWIGEGLATKGGLYYTPYLQSGHALLLLILLFVSTFSDDGFPLLTLPDAWREEIWGGLRTTFAINAASAIYGGLIAERKKQPVDFWVAKVLLFGGVALGELSQAVPDPPKPRKQKRPGRL